MQKYNNSLIDFGNLFKKKMMELNFTPKQLAKELNLTENYILQIERGEKNISLLSLYRISKVLKTHPSEIVKGLK